jgi:ABC-type multidrug transport system fused ATPase/permease subunit
LIVIRLRKSVAKASSRSEYAYLQYSGALADFWPNTALGNAHNQTIWHKERDSVGRAFYTASNRLEALRQSGNVLLAAASLGPTIFLIVVIASSEARDPAIIAALIVSLTRIFLIVNSLSTLVHRVLDYSSLHARVRVLLDAHTGLRDCTEYIINGSINISVNGTTVRDIDQGKHLISPNRQGRFTVTGSNGSGKSTFLLSLKQQYGATCFLLPSNYFDLCWEKDCRSLSTGQRLIEHLAEIFRIEKITHIALDEWDANLDVDNTRKIDEILRTLSTKKVIIEVRHNRS